MNSSREGSEWGCMRETLNFWRGGREGCGTQCDLGRLSSGRDGTGSGLEKGKNRQEQPLQGSSGIRNELCYLTVFPGPPALHSSQAFLQKTGKGKSTIVSEIRILGSCVSLGMCSLDFITPPPWPQEAGFQDFISSPYRGQEVH